MIIIKQWKTNRPMIKIETFEWKTGRRSGRLSGLCLQLCIVQYFCCCCQQLYNTNVYIKCYAQKSLLTYVTIGNEHQNKWKDASIICHFDCCSHFISINSHVDTYNGMATKRHIIDLKLQYMFWRFNIIV